MPENEEKEIKYNAEGKRILEGDELEQAVEEVRQLIKDIRAEARKPPGVSKIDKENPPSNVSFTKDMAKLKENSKTPEESNIAYDKESVLGNISENLEKVNSVVAGEDEIIPKFILRLYEEHAQIISLLNEILATLPTICKGGGSGDSGGEN